MVKRRNLIAAMLLLAVIPAAVLAIMGVETLQDLQCTWVAGMERILDDFVPGRLHRPVIDKLGGYLAFGSAERLKSCIADQRTPPPCPARTSCQLVFQGKSLLPSGVRLGRGVARRRGLLVLPPSVRRATSPSAPTGLSGPG